MNVHDPGKVIGPKKFKNVETPIFGELSNPEGVVINSGSRKLRTPSVRPSVCLSVSLSVCLSVCLLPKGFQTTKAITLNLES